MKENIIISDEAYRADMEKLWRKIRTLRNAAEYKDVSFTLQHWMLSCDGQNIKSGTNQNTSLTDLFFRLPLQPTNSELIAEMDKAGVDVDSDLPVLLTFTVDIEYTRIA